MEVASVRPGVAQDHDRVLALTCLLNTPVAQVYIIPYFSPPPPLPTPTSTFYSTCVSKQVGGCLSPDHRGEAYSVRRTIPYRT